MPQSIEYAPVAQLDRVSDSDSEGRWFESSRAYHVGMDCIPTKTDIAFAVSVFFLHSVIPPLPNRTRCAGLRFGFWLTSKVLRNYIQSPETIGFRALSCSFNFE